MQPRDTAPVLQVEIKQSSSGSASASKTMQTHSSSTRVSYRLPSRSSSSGKLLSANLAGYPYPPSSATSTSASLGRRNSRHKAVNLNLSGHSLMSSRESVHTSSGESNSHKQVSPCSNAMIEQFRIVSFEDPHLGTRTKVSSASVDIQPANFRYQQPTNNTERACLHSAYSSTTNSGHYGVSPLAYLSKKLLLRAYPSPCSCCACLLPGTLCNHTTTTCANNTTAARRCCSYRHHQNHHHCHRYTTTASLPSFPSSPPPSSSPSSPSSPPFPFIITSPISTRRSSPGLYPLSRVASIYGVEPLRSWRLPRKSKSSLEGFSYPDPLEGGHRVYCRRVGEMAVLEAETLRQERLQMSKRKSSRSNCASD